MEKGADPTFIIPDSVRFVKAFAVSIFARLRGMILRGEMMKPIMIVRNLYKIYRQGENEVHALDGVSLTDGKRVEFVAIVGRSGSGKSTLMNVLGVWTHLPPVNIFSTAKMSMRYRRTSCPIFVTERSGLFFKDLNLVPGLT